MKTVRIKAVLLNLLIVIVVSILGVVASEIGLRFLVPGTSDYYVLFPNMKKVFRPTPTIMPGVQGDAHYVINEHGIRARDFGPDGTEYRILAIGGSTTENLYLDEPETWTYLVQEMLGPTRSGKNVWIGNLGRSGLTARSHVVEVKHLTKQYPGIDAIMILAGANDLTLALAKGENYIAPPPITEPEAEQEEIRKAFLMAPDKLHNPGTNYLLADDAPWYKSTALYQLVKRAKQGMTARVADSDGLIQDDHGQTYVGWRQHRKEASKILVNSPDLNAALEEYRRNLHAIVDLSERYATRLIFMTQPALWKANLTDAEKDLLWMGGTGKFQTEPGQAYYSVALLAEIMDKFNDALLHVCQSRTVECIDLASSIPRNATMFYDDLHFTEAGSRMVAEEIVNYLRPKPPWGEH